MATTAASGLARVNGIQLAYQIHGSGTPLVLLHGAFGSVEMFGPNIAALAAGRQVIGVDLQSHGRTPAVDRPMRFETMADDIAALIRHLGHEQRDGWHPEMIAGFDQMGPEIAEPMKQTPLYEVYREVAPRVEDWPILVAQLTGLVKLDYDWTAEVRGLPMPVLIVVGDADGLPARHAVAFFELLGGGERDASWDRSGMTRHGLAILPRVTHYDINVAPALATTVAPFLDED